MGRRSINNYALSIPRYHLIRQKSKHLVLCSSFEKHSFAALRKHETKSAASEQSCQTAELHSHSSVCNRRTNLAETRKEKQLCIRIITQKPKKWMTKKNKDNCNKWQMTVTWENHQQHSDQQDDERQQTNQHARRKKWKDEATRKEPRRIRKTPYKSWQKCNIYMKKKK